MAKPEPTLFDDADKAGDARREAEAEADVAAGRLIPHEEVRDWLKTWGTAEEGPPPEKWFKP